MILYWPFGIWIKGYQGNVIQFILSNRVRIRASSQGTSNFSLTMKMIMSMIFTCMARMNHRSGSIAIRPAIWAFLKSCQSIDARLRYRFWGFITSNCNRALLRFILSWKSLFNLNIHENGNQSRLQGCCENSLSTFWKIKLRYELTPR